MKSPEVFACRSRLFRYARSSWGKNMRIVSWNCNGALRKKTQFLDNLEADILIVQECEDPDQSNGAYQKWAGDFLWVGPSKNKGLGIFSQQGVSLSKCNWAGEFKVNGFKSNHPSLQWSTSDLELFLPCIADETLCILAVWTKLADSSVFGYVGQLWKYLQIHWSEIVSHKAIVLGDFNSNAIWDKPDRWWNHSAVVDELEEMGLKSLYHAQHREKQGLESTPTFYMCRNENRPYHIDYAFLPENIIKRSQITIGEKTKWLEVSDHLPLIVDIAP